MNKNIHITMGVCLKENIKIYPIVYDRIHLKIQINFDGRIKTGTELYKIASDQKKLQQKIGELYYDIAKRIQDKR